MRRETYLGCNTLDIDRNASLRAMLYILLNELRIRNTRQATSKLFLFFFCNGPRITATSHVRSFRRGEDIKRDFQKVDDVKDPPPIVQNRSNQRIIAVQKTKRVLGEQYAPLTATVKNINRRWRWYTARTRSCSAILR